MEYIDGVNCINVYSKGKTELGRILTNFAHTPFVCDDGRFESLEGYWYWLQTKDDRLRLLFGFQAKEYGKKVIDQNGKIFVENFEEKIKKAIRAKILQNKLYNMIAASKLPFVHFYEYGDKKVFKPEHDWIMKYLEECRKKLQVGGFPK